MLIKIHKINIYCNNLLKRTIIKFHIMSAEFTKIISDFVRDILITFPEYSRIISKWWSLEVGASNDADFVFTHCTRVFKDHFFNILNNFNIQFDTVNFALSK